MICSGETALKNWLGFQACIIRQLFPSSRDLPCHEAQISKATFYTRQRYDWSTRIKCTTDKVSTQVNGEAVSTVPLEVLLQNLQAPS